jgi:hypothetical protein
MSKKRFFRLAAVTMLASAAMIVTTQPASAAEVQLPAGVGCPNFPLGLDGGAPPPEKRNFTDRNGNQVRILAGKSGAVTWTNLSTGKFVTFQSRGTHLRETTFSPTSQLLEFSGHVAIVLFPTDKPAGPSTTQISGRLVLRFDPTTGLTEVLKQEGNQIDVCARLS